MEPTQNQETERKQIELDEALTEYNKTRDEARANSPFITLKANEQDDFEFTGVIYSRISSGTNEKNEAWRKEVLDFEVTERTADGQNKVLSFGKTNKIVPILIQKLKAGDRSLTITRTGEGMATRYAIVEKRSKKPRGTLREM